MAHAPEVVIRYPLSQFVQVVELVQVLQLLEQLRQVEPSGLGYL